MNTLEPVIAFIDERIKQLCVRPEMPIVANEARVQELQLIRTICTGLIEQDKLLQNALDGAVMRR